MYRLIYISLLLIMFSFTADNNWKVCQQSEMKAELLKTETFFKSHPTFSVSVNYSSYKGHGSDVAFEKADGFIKCDGTKLHSFLVGIRTIQNEKYRVVIDTSEMTIAVSDPEKLTNSAPPSLTSMQLQKNITACKQASLTNGDKKWRVEYSAPIPLVAEEYTLGSDARVKDHTMFYRNSYAVDDEDAKSTKAQPKLKITFSNYNLTYKPDLNKDFSVSVYFKETKEGKLTVNSAFQGYEINDLRVSKNIK